MFIKMKLFGGSDYIINTEQIVDVCRYKTGGIVHIYMSTGKSYPVDKEYEKVLFDAIGKSV